MKRAFVCGLVVAIVIVVGGVFLFTGCSDPQERNDRINAANNNAHNAFNAHNNGN